MIGMSKGVQVVIFIFLSACLQQLAATPYQLETREFNRNHHDKEVQKSSALRASEISNVKTDQEKLANQYRYHALKAYNREYLQTVEDAVIQKLLAYANGLVKKEKNPTCLTAEDAENISSVPQLDMNTLRRIIATIDSEAVSLSKTTSTIILAENGRVVSENAVSTSAINSFFGHFSPSTYPKEIWINRAPCPTCVLSIMNNYDSGTGVTIYVAEFEQQANILGTTKSLKCLAKMFHNHYTIRPWNWELFRDTFNLKEECKSIIDQVVGRDTFMTKQEEVSSVLKFIEEISKVPESTIMEWCEVPTITM